jgi:hypothetical protein
MTYTRTYTEADKNRLFANLENRKKEAQLTRKLSKLNKEYCILEKTHSSSNTDNEAYLIELKLEDIQTKMSKISATFG